MQRAGPFGQQPGPTDGAAAMLPSASLSASIAQDLRLCHGLLSDLREHHMQSMASGGDSSASSQTIKELQLELKRERSGRRRLEQDHEDLKLMLRCAMQRQWLFMQGRIMLEPATLPLQPFHPSSSC
jgi:hypothetical protein